MNDTPKPIRRTRAEAVRDAIASIEIEGGAVDAETRALLDRWAAGEIDDDGLMAAVIDLAGGTRRRRRR